MKRKKIFLPGSRAANAFKAIAFLFLSFAGSNTHAQCVAPTLNISTGYDPMAGTTVTPSNTQVEPKWTSAVSADAAAAITAMGDLIGCYDALPCGVWPVPIPGSTWAMGQNDWGYMTDLNPAHTFSDTFSRPFTVCGTDSINLVIDSMITDDGITQIAIDGTVLLSIPFAGSIHHYSSSTYSLGPLSGTHTISIVVLNLNNGVYKNAIGIDVKANLVSASGTASLVSETCPDYTCDDGCDEKCYWKLTGNHIVPGHNIFGTLTKDDIRILTNSAQRAVVKSSGEVGIHQVAPSTTLDVDCVPPATAPSGLQFEHLPSGQGNILVVDKNGYVYISKQMARPAEPATTGDVQDQINDLKKQIEDLKALVVQNSAPGNMPNMSSLSVSPNPSDGELNATYTIPGNFSKAVIRITDEMGRIVVTKPIENNSGTMHLTIPSSVKATTLVVSMIVDGNSISSKQLSFLSR